MTENTDAMEEMEEATNDSLVEDNTTNDTPDVEAPDGVEPDSAPDALESGTMVMCDNGEEVAVITRKEAQEKGVNRYFTGFPCRNGHMSERKVKGYVCVICARIRAKARRKIRLAEDPDYKEKIAKKRREKHKERYASDPSYKAKILAKAKERRLKRAADRKSGQAEAQIKGDVPTQDEGVGKAA